MSREYGIQPWHLDDMPFGEINEYVDDMKRRDDEARKRARQQQQRRR